MHETIICAFVYLAYLSLPLVSVRWRHRILSYNWCYRVPKGQILKHGQNCQLDGALGWEWECVAIYISDHFRIPLVA